MTTKGPQSRFAFYWNEQRGKCALMITENCRTHGGQMIERTVSTPVRQYKSQPTWDHVYPKPRTPEQEPLQLLACAACNHERGNKPATAQYVARSMVLLEEWLKSNPSALIGVPNAKAERRRLIEAKRLVEGKPARRAFATAKRAAALKAMQAAVDAPGPAPPPVKLNYEKHPFLPRAGYDLPLSRRASNNAESQAAALKGIAERMKAQGRTEDAQLITAKAANILAAVRGKPPERK